MHVGRCNWVESGVLIVGVCGAGLLACLASNIKGS